MKYKFYNRPDFRDALYDKYVSTFKSIQIKEEANIINQRLDILDQRYHKIFKDLDRSAKILELGCGQGYMLQYLQRQGFTNLKGIDYSEEQVVLAKSNGLNVERADVAEFLTDLDASFDVILGLDFIEHFHKDEIMNIISLIHRSLITNGILILQTPNGEGLFSRQIMYGDLTHLTILTQKTMLQILNLYGFSKIRFYSVNPISNGLKGFIRQIIWKIVINFVRTLKRIESGKNQNIWTENIICTAVKKVKY